MGNVISFNVCGKLRYYHGNRLTGKILKKLEDKDDIFYYVTLCCANNKLIGGRWVIV